LDMGLLLIEVHELEILVLHTNQRLILGEEVLKSAVCNGKLRRPSICCQVLRESDQVEEGVGSLRSHLVAEVIMRVVEVVVRGRFSRASKCAFLLGVEMVMLVPLTGKRRYRVTRNMGASIIYV